MNKTKLGILVRKLGLAKFADDMRFVINRYKNSSKNAAFLKKYPGIKLPPDYLMYESYLIDYKAYWNDGRETAEWIWNLIQKHSRMPVQRVLDWGCGPGRVIRHFPKLSDQTKFYGSDYNEQSIKWCSENLPEIQFSRNQLTPRLDFEGGFVDAVYGLSIFTHLSNQLHFDWFEELKRVTAPGGLIILTLQGDAFRVKLSADEVEKFDAGELVVRSSDIEGHRTYAAFQPEKFLKEQLFKGVEVCEKIERQSESGSPLQDYWVLRKI